MSYGIKTKILYVVDRESKKGSCTCAECIAFQISMPFKNVHRNLRRYLDQGLINKIRALRGHTERAQYIITRKGSKRLRFFLSQEKTVSLK